eukprot:7559379-Lingulodinium_polyedra.AAC.1
MHSATLVCAVSARVAMHGCAWRHGLRGICHAYGLGELSQRDQCSAVVVAMKKPPASTPIVTTVAIHSIRMLLCSTSTSITVVVIPFVSMSHGSITTATDVTICVVVIILDSNVDRGQRCRMRQQPPWLL